MAKHKIIRTKGQRIAYTNTSRVPDKLLAQAIKFVAAEVDLDHVVVHVKKYGSGRHAGLAYHGIPSITNLDGLKSYEWSYLITVRVANEDNEFDWVSILGHEAKHIEQYKRGTLRREKRARNCEPQANAFGHWIARKWLDRQ